MFFSTPFTCLSQPFLEHTHIEWQTNLATPKSYAKYCVKVCGEFEQSFHSRFLFFFWFLFNKLSCTYTTQNTQTFDELNTGPNKVQPRNVRARLNLIFLWQLKIWWIFFLFHWLFFLFLLLYIEICSGWWHYFQLKWHFIIHSFPFNGIIATFMSVSLDIHFCLNNFSLSNSLENTLHAIQFTEKFMMFLVCVRL